MTSLLNEPDVSFHFHQPSIRDSQPLGLSPLDPDFFSDPSNLISLIVNGSDNHGISSSRRHERQRAYAHLTPEELLNILIDKEYEAKRLSKILRAAVLRLNAQSARISELERDSQEALDRLRQINQSRIEAQQDASRADQELDLYRAQLENARQELIRAEEALRVLRQQREEAEEAASRARDKARRLRQQRLVDAARAEGRRWGFEDGFERAKESFAGNGNIIDELPTAAPLFVSRRRRAEESAAEEADDGVHSSRSSTPELIQPTEVRIPSSARPESTIPDPFSDLPSRPSRPPTFHPPPPPGPRPRPVEQDLRPQNPPQLSIITEPDRPVRPVDTGNQTPGISVFRVDFSDVPQEPRPTHHDPHQQSNVSNGQWVTAQQHHTFGAPSRTQDQARYDPSPDQEGPSRSQAPRGPSLTPQDEKKKFSWYRSFSFRNKFGKRRVLDPDPTSEASAPGVAADPDEDEMYDRTRAPSSSWYHPKGTSLGTRGSRHRTNSFGSGSTHTSQLQLIRTPAPLLSRDINMSNGSLSAKSGKEATMVKKLKEKESLLSVINEDPMSREHTPITDRFRVDTSRVPNIRHFTSSSTVDSHLARGPIDLSNSDSRYPQLGPASVNNGSSRRHRRTMSEVTPLVTIDIQTPSNSRTSSEKPRHHDELPNRFLSPSIASQPLPRPSTPDRSRTDGGIPNARTRPRTPSQLTPAMDIRESYLAKTAAAESSSTSAVRESHDMAGPSSRQSDLPNPAVSSPMGKSFDLPAASSSPNLNGQTLARVLSNGSMGTYSRFDPTTYVDPAFFEPNAEPRRDVPTRPASRNSALSYISENGR